MQRGTRARTGQLLKENWKRYFGNVMCCIINIALMLACVQSVRRGVGGGGYIILFIGGDNGVGHTGRLKAGHHPRQPFKVKGRRPTMAASGGGQSGLQRCRLLGKAAR